MMLYLELLIFYNWVTNGTASLIITDNRLDIVGTTETWFSNDDKNNMSVVNTCLDSGCRIFINDQYCYASYLHSININNIKEESQLFPLNISKFQAIWLCLSTELVSLCTLDIVL